jgi:hypothetical protein
LIAFPGTLTALAAHANAKAPDKPGLYSLALARLPEKIPIFVSFVSDFFVTPVFV